MPDSAMASLQIPLLLIVFVDNEYHYSYDECNIFIPCRASYQHPLLNIPSLKCSIGQEMNKWVGITETTTTFYQKSLE